MDELTEKAIKAAEDSELAYCKFITPNDAGQTGAHQAGYHIHKEAYKIAFDKAHARGANDEKFVTIKWQDDFETNSRFIYYGTGTRNEYRLTRFGRDFPYLRDDDIGSLLVLCKKTDDYYLGFVLEKDEQIDDFLARFELSPTNANGLIKELSKVASNFESEFAKYVATLDGSSFPTTAVLARSARDIFDRCSGHNTQSIIANPDGELISWVDTEYKLFKEIEKRVYSPILSKQFEDVDHFVESANTILNRRKSRAGKSLEHHLANVFDAYRIPYTPQGTTEGTNKPDFIMPSITDYHTTAFPADKLIFLGAKTTCKDRWRQVLSEADRIPAKHLFTLQPGISSSQLQEMKKSKLTLVVPEQNVITFPQQHREELMTLRTFIGFAKEKLPSARH